MRFPFLRYAALITIISATVSAQQLTGSLKGTVTDQLGSLVVNARVIAIAANGAMSSVTTSSAGVYDLKNLRVGKYTLRIVAPGFNEFEEKDIEIEASKQSTFDAQLTVALEDQQVTVEAKGVSTDSDENANALVLSGRELETLPNDPQALAATLQAMAGPSDGEGGAKITVDGFSNGQIPPKEAIREVRINQNPYSAQNEFPGYSGIEIFTQPGSDKWRGGGSFDFNDESLNSRNPFTTRRAPFQQRRLSFSLTGPIVAKRASFSVYYDRTVSDSNSVVNATILDPVTLQPVAINQSLVTPQTSHYGSARVDFKINKRHTLVARFGLNKSVQNLSGIGGFSLPTRGYRGNRSDYSLQATQTAIINEKMVNETRVQLARGSFQQTSISPEAALSVQDSFLGGGSQVGSSSDRRDRFELQNFTSWSHGKHFAKVGGRVRYVNFDSVSPNNFGGTYTFAGGFGPKLNANGQIVLDNNGQTEIVEVSSLERYRRTLQFSRQGLSPAAIRVLGGGASQFSIAAGTPDAKVTQTDYAFYFQDDWKVTPQFTLSPGLRYENQNNISSNYNFAPRLGFAWSPVFGGTTKIDNTKPATATPTTPAARVVTTTTASPQPARSAGPAKMVFRGGIGLFYSRLSEDVTLQTVRYNGVNQQQFLVTDPTVLNLFPVIPPVALLDAFSQPQTRRVISDDMVTWRSLRMSFTCERVLTKTLRVAVTYSHSRIFDSSRSVNINAPLGGTFISTQPGIGVRPLGQDAGNVLEYQSNGRTVSNNLSINLNGSVRKINLYVSYGFGKSRNTDFGQSGSPFDAYDFSNEWSRSPFGSLNFFYGGGSYQLPTGTNINLFVIANSGSPFNITIGRDLNGDTFFSERPAFATDLTKPGVINTPLGAFDPNPTAGQEIIPRNLGRGPAFMSANIGIDRVFKFGKAIEPKTVAPAVAPKPGATDASKPTPKPPLQRPYTLGFSIYATNVFNRNNKGLPVGNMSSPYFLQSASASATFFGSGGGSGGNRQISVRMRLSF